MSPTCLFSLRLPLPRYARACGLPPLHPEANITQALQTVYANNVMKYKGTASGKG